MTPLSIGDKIGHKEGGIRLALEVGESAYERRLRQFYLMRPSVGGPEVNDRYELTY
jgi:hypothetical protein